MDMHADMVATKRSPKVRPLTIEHLDGRTRGSKRARALAAELTRGWDGITEVQRQAVERAGMLCALAEDLYQPSDWVTLGGFPNRRWHDSSWQTRGVCHGPSGAD
jgi:hypothetical protein